MLPGATCQVANLIHEHCLANLFHELCLANLFHKHCLACKTCLLPPSLVLLFSRLSHACPSPLLLFSRQSYACPLPLPLLSRLSHARPLPLPCLLAGAQGEGAAGQVHGEATQAQRIQRPHAHPCGKQRMTACRKAVQEGRAPAAGVIRMEFMREMMAYLVYSGCDGTVLRVVVEPGAAQQGACAKELQLLVHILTVEHL